MWAEIEHLAELVRADHPSRRSVDNFEDLAGPIERLAAGIRHVQGLIAIGDASEQQALEQIALRAGRLYRQTVGGVLQAVTERQDGGLPEVLVDIATFLADGTPANACTDVFVLNYDAWLDSALLALRDKRRGKGDAFELSDEFDGRTGRVRQVNGTNVSTLRWRGDPWRPTGRSIRLHHLHGAANWLTNGNDILKVPMEEMRGCDQFGVWARGEATGYDPVVVLGDSKERLVAREPFNETYGALRRVISQSDRLVIAGYSFRDVPLNKAIGEALPDASELVVVDPAKLRWRASNATGVPFRRVRHVEQCLPEGLQAI